MWCFYWKTAILCSLQGSPVEDRNFGTALDDVETGEVSFSGQDDPSDHASILEWAKVRKSFS